MLFSIKPETHHAVNVARCKCSNAVNKAMRSKTNSIAYYKISLVAEKMIMIWFQTACLTYRCKFTVTREKRSSKPICTHSTPHTNRNIK